MSSNLFSEDSCSEIELSDAEVELICSLRAGKSDKVSVSTLDFLPFKLISYRSALSLLGPVDESVLTEEELVSLILPCALCIF